MTSGDGAEKASDAKPESKIVPSSVAPRSDASKYEVATEAAAYYRSLQLLASDPQAQAEIKDALLDRVNADTKLGLATAALQNAKAAEINAAAEHKREEARKLRIDNDRIEEVKEQNRPFVKFALRYGVKLGAGLCWIIGVAEGGAGLYRILTGAGTANLGVSAGFIAFGIVLAIAPSAIASLIGKMRT